MICVMLAIRVMVIRVAMLVFVRRVVRPLLHVPLRATAGSIHALLEHLEAAENHVQFSFHFAVNSAVRLRLGG